MFDLKKIKKLLDNKVTVYSFLIIFLFLFMFYSYATLSLAKPVFLDNTDPITYHQNAVYFSETGMVLDDYWPYGYYAVLGIVYKVFGQEHYVGKLFNVFLLIGTMILIFLLLEQKKLFKVKNTKFLFLIFFLLVLIDPEFRYYTSTLYKEILFMFSTVLTLYLFTLYKDDSKKHMIILGSALAVVGMITAQNNAWFILPLFFGVLFVLVDFKKYKNTFIKFKKGIPFLAAFIIVFLLLIPIFSQLYVHSTGNKHLFPTNGDRLLFYLNAPTGCQGVTFTLNNNECVPDESFMLDFAASKGLDYESLTSFEKDELRGSYVKSYFLSNPFIVFDRLGPFLDLWLVPSLRESQRLIINDSALTNYLRFTFLLALLGLIVMLFRKQATKNWLWILVFYGACTIAYLMTYYLMRYKMYYRVFELLLAAYFIYIVLSFIIKSKHLDKIFSKKVISFKYFLVITLILLFAVFIFINPYVEARKSTSYTSLLLSIDADSLKIEGLDTRLPALAGLNLVDECVDKRLGTTLNGTVISQGLVEFYPRGEIFRNQKALDEWIIKNTRNLNSYSLTEFKSLKSSDGVKNVEIVSGSQRLNMNVLVINGLVLAPEFTNFYYSSC
ncbi:MAG: hypothetical protein ACMXX9_04740 [Candidatus Woesearchaeota archaeon]